MKKNIRRVLALAVCLIMVIGTMAPYAFAEGETPTPTLKVGDEITLDTNDSSQLPEAPEGTEWQGPVEGTEAGVLKCGKEAGETIWGTEWEPIDAKDYVESDKQHYKKETTYVDKYYYKWAAPLGSGLKKGDECIPDKHGVTIKSVTWFNVIKWKNETSYYWKVNDGNWFEQKENFLLEKRTEPVDKYYKLKSEIHTHTDSCYTAARTTYTWTLVTKETPQGGTITISGEKIWKDNNDAAMKRPTEVTIQLSKGNEVVKTATASAKDGWKYSFKDLPKTDKEGNLITYTVKEVNVPDGYTSTVGTAKYEGDTKIVIDITNTYTPEITEKYGSLELHKFVEGLDRIPEGYKATFKIEGPENYSQTVEIDGITKAQTGAGYEYCGSKRFEKLKTGTYTITETDVMKVDGYAYTTSHRAETYGPAVANSTLDQGNEPSFEPGKSVTVVVTKDSTTRVAFNNSYTKTGGGYEPTLHALTINKQVVGLDNVPAGYEVTVNITNKTTGAVKTVKLGANGTQTVFLSYGEYTLTEVSAAVDGYKQVGQTFSKNDFRLDGSMLITVTNTYEKDAEEPIVDPDPTEPATPVDPAKQDDEDQTEVPKTGDNLPMSLAIYGILAAGALLGIRKATKRAAK